MYNDNFESLSVRAQHILHRASIHDYDDLATFCNGDPDNLTRLRNMGEKTLREVCTACAEHMKEAGRKCSGCPAGRECGLDQEATLTLRYHYKSAATVLTRVFNTLLECDVDTYLDNIDIDALRTQYYVVFRTLPMVSMNKRFLLEMLRNAAYAGLTNREYLKDHKKLLNYCAREVESGCRNFYEK